MRIQRAVFVLGVWLSAAAPALAQPPPQAPPAFSIEVIEAAPLPGLNLRLQDIPAPVQTALAKDIANSGALDLADFLNRRFDDVYVNEMQGNPFQPDVNYRGYTASPLLGTPQGLSVYMDGVRLNQPFGDVVAWDLIPRVAIASVTLMPGSNPLFGLNTLGGALAIQTKDGRNSPGTSAEIVYGSGNRRSIEFSHGGHSANGFDWWFGGNLFAEDGWRESSPSDVNQLFGKLGWSSATSSLALSVAYADNDLTGNGLQDTRLLAADYASVYTIPDQTKNRSTLLNLSGQRTPSRTLTLSGTAYYRDIRATTLNADLNDDSLDESLYQLSAADIRALTAAGYTGFPITGSNASNTPFPSWRCIAQALQRDEPDEKCNGLLTNTETTQQNYGASGQATWSPSSGRYHHQITTGAALDASRVDFTQLSQFGYLNPDRTVTAVDAYADGSTNADGEPVDTRVNLHGTPWTWSLYATDTLGIGDAWHATFSARYNRTTIDNADRLTPGGGPGSLDGHYVYGRVNPAVGVTYSPSPMLNLYAGYGEGSRAPTSIELGCADPTNACRLPNALAGDPPLAQVVTRTFEAGIRSGRESGVSWHASVFRADNHDDILFVASEQTGFGYFKNFGQTRREGIEVGVRDRVGRATFGGGYTYLNATYQSTETFDGSANGTNDSALAGAKGLDGTIQVTPGDRIPLIPAHMLKAYADVQAMSRLSIDLDLVAVGSSYARGNENNLSQPDGVYYIGPGTSPAYGIVNAGARFALAKHVDVLAYVDNIFDHHYDTAAQLGSTGFTASGAFIARPLPAVNGEFPVQSATFFAPGAPTRARIGTTVRF